MITRILSALLLCLPALSGSAAFAADENVGADEQVEFWVYKPNGARVPAVICKKAVVSSSACHAHKETMTQANEALKAIESAARDACQAYQRSDRSKCLDREKTARGYPQVYARYASDNARTAQVCGCRVNRSF